MGENFMPTNKRIMTHLIRWKGIHAIYSNIKSKNRIIHLKQNLCRQKTNQPKPPNQTKMKQNKNPAITVRSSTLVERNKN